MHGLKCNNILFVISLVAPSTIRPFPSVSFSKLASCSGYRCVDWLTGDSLICVKPTVGGLMRYSHLCRRCLPFSTIARSGHPVATYPSVNRGLNKYHLCLHGEDTEGLRVVPQALNQEH